MRGGVHMCPPCHVFAYICANTCTSVLKNLTFLNYKFGKRQDAFYPDKLFRLKEKNKVCRKYQTFIKGGPYDLDQRPLQPVKNYKSQSFLGDTLKKAGTNRVNINYSITR